MDIAHYIRLVLSLSFLFGILYVVLKLSQNWRTKRYTGDIVVKDRLNVDSGVALLLVEVRGKEYLMSLGAKQVELLTEVASQ